MEYKYQNAHCFLLFSRVEEHYTPEQSSLLWKSFNSAVENKIEAEIIDKQKKIHKKYNGNKVLRIPYNNNNESVDMDVLVETINQIACDKIIKKFHYSLIYKMLKEGLLGTGYEDLTMIGFIELMQKNGFDVGNDSNLGAHCPEGKYPNWKWRASTYNRDTKKKMEKALSFATEIKQKYEEIIAINRETAEEIAE